MAAEGTDAANYVMLYRGGNTKYTWKTGLEDRVSYRFRVQVRTTEGVGQWSNSVQVVRKAPSTSLLVVGGGGGGGGIARRSVCHDSVYTDCHALQIQFSQWWIINGGGDRVCNLAEYFHHVTFEF